MTFKPIEGMKENPIKYEGTMYYPLGGLDGYYGSHDGRVLSMKYRLPRLLRPTRYRNSEVYYLKIHAGDDRSVSRSRISYIPEFGISLE